jgi:hypothetical protein
VAELIGLGMIDRQRRSSAEKSHRNHLGSHFDHAFVAPYSIVWEGLSRQDTSCGVQCVKRNKKEKTGSGVTITAGWFTTINHPLSSSARRCSTLSIWQVMCQK